MSVLADAVTDYLTARRALGFKLERHDRFLGELIGGLDAAGTTVLTVDDMVAWATTPADADPYWWAARLSVARGFARLVASFARNLQ